MMRLSTRNIAPSLATGVQLDALIAFRIVFLVSVTDALYESVPRMVLADTVSGLCGVRCCSWCKVAYAACLCISARLPNTGVSASIRFTITAVSLVIFAYVQLLKAVPPAQAGELFSPGLSRRT
jgi:hypothetical protein